MRKCVFVQSGAKFAWGLITNNDLQAIADIWHLCEAVCPGFREGHSQRACHRGRKTNWTFPVDNKCKYCVSKGEDAVGQLFETLLYKPELRELDCRWCQSFRSHHGPGVDSASKRKEYQEYFLLGKGYRCVMPTTLPPSRVECLEIWEPRPPGTLRSSPGLLRYHSTFNFTVTVKFNPYPTAFPYGNGMVLHFYQQQESSTTKTVHKVINKGLKTYV